MKVEQATHMGNTGNARFRAMVSTSGQVEAIEVYSHDDVAAGVARMWHDLSMVTAAWRVLEQLKKVGRVYVSASPDTLNLAGGKFCRLLAGLAGQGIEVNVMLGQRHGIYDPQKLLQFVTASRPFAIRLGVALQGRAWDWAALARTVGAAFVTVDESAAEGLDEFVRRSLGALEVVGVGVNSRDALEALERVGAVWCSGPAARAKRRAAPGARGVKSAVATMVAGAVLAACASAPVPVVPDGSRRVPVNDPQRLQQLRTTTAEQNVAVAERSVLMDEVSKLRRQVSDLQTAVKVLLLTPADPPAAPVAAQAASAPVAAPAGRAGAPSQAIAPSAAKATQPPAAPAPAPTPAAVPDAAKQSARAVEQTERGTVFRVFHASGEAKFTPVGEFADELVAAAKKGQAIEVHGRTDSRRPTEANTRVAIARAVQARNWLVDQGVEANRIRARYSSAGNFLVEGDGDDAKALNRRVEIVIRADQPKTAASKTTKQGA